MCIILSLLCVVMWVYYSFLKPQSASICVNPWAMASPVCFCVWRCANICYLVHSNRLIYGSTVLLAYTLLDLFLTGILSKVKVTHLNRSGCRRRYLLFSVLCWVLTEVVCLAMKYVIASVCLKRTGWIQRNAKQRFSNRCVCRRFRVIWWTWCSLFCFNALNVMEQICGAATVFLLTTSNY